MSQLPDEFRLPAGLDVQVFTFSTAVSSRRKLWDAFQFRQTPDRFAPAIAMPLQE